MGSSKWRFSAPKRLNFCFSRCVLSANGRFNWLIPIEPPESRCRLGSSNVGFEVRQVRWLPLAFAELDACITNQHSWLLLGIISSIFAYCGLVVEIATDKSAAGLFGVFLVVVGKHFCLFFFLGGCGSNLNSWGYAAVSLSSQKNRCHCEHPFLSHIHLLFKGPFQKPPPKIFFWSKSL